MRSSLMCAHSFGMAGIVLCALASSPAVSAEQAAPDPSETARAKFLAEKCSVLACRTQSRELQLKLDGGIATFQTELLPYADEGAVILYPGEAIQVDFPADGKAMEPHFGMTIDHIDGPKVVGGKRVPTAPRSDSRANFWFDFQQEGTGMLLKVKSDIGYNVRYRAVMLVPEKDRLKPVDTSSCPVISYGFVTESWPYQIAMIVLSEFHVVTDNDLSCY